MFGDIFTDLGAALVGGLGLAASANLHPGRDEPVRVASTVPRRSSRARTAPTRSRRSWPCRMMLDYLGEKTAAKRVEDAVVRVLRGGKLPNLGMDSGVGTNAVGDLVLAELG